MIRGAFCFLIMFLVATSDVRSAEVRERTPIHAKATTEMIMSPSVEAYQDIYFTAHFPNKTETKNLVIPVGFTIAQTLEYMYVIKYGKVCFSEKDIWSINEYDTNLAEEKYWTILLNGNFLNVNSQTILRKGDSLELSYHRSE